MVRERVERGRRGRKYSRGTRNSSASFGHPPHGEPHHGDQNFAVLVKVLFRIIQCLHHGLNLADQKRNGHFGKAFQSKLDELNSFIKPAFSNQSVKQAIQTLNLGWVTAVNEALSGHYSSSLEDLKGTARKLPLGTLDLNKAQQIAIGWAQRNFRKKLKTATLDKFRSEIADLVNHGPMTSLPQASPQAGPSGLGSSSVDKTPPNLIPEVVSPGSCDSYVSAVSRIPSGSKPIVLSPPAGNTNRKGGKPKKSKPVETQTPQPVTTPLGPPAPSCHSSGPQKSTVKCRPKNPNFRPRRLSPVVAEHTPPRGSNSPSDQGQTRVPITPWRAPNTNYKNKDWRLPIIGSSVRTLVIGTSNISKIDHTRDPSVALFSFPGAKFIHFTELFKKAKLARQVYPDVNKVVFSCGINDRGNCPAKTIHPEFKRAANRAREVFPRAQLFFVEPQWEETLPDNEKENLAGFKKLVQTKSSGLVHLIPSIAPRNFMVIHDKVHWTTSTANRLLDHWLVHIGQISGN